MNWLIGWNTFWLDFHLTIAFLVLGSSAMVFGVIYLTTKPDELLINRLKWLSMLSLVSVVVLLITGVLPDMNFGFGNALSFATTNDFGNFTSSVSDNALASFTGPLLFDIMEHITLIGPAIAGVVTLLIWHYGERVITDAGIKRSVLALMLTGTAWLFVILWIGMYLTKILTFPFTS
jgi:hypothetical protein